MLFQLRAVSGGGLSVCERGPEASRIMELLFTDTRRHRLGQDHGDLVHQTVRRPADLPLEGQKNLFSETAGRAKAE